MQPTFFSTPAEFRKWLKKHHESAAELWAGFHKKGSGIPSMTWPESVDEALCFGWIDGIRKNIDETSYQIRFTPRRQSSTWSKVNVDRARALIEAGRMTPAGLAAFEARKEESSGLYSYEQRPPELPEPYAKIMRKNRRAKEFFDAQPPSYRRLATWLIVSAKREETRLRRLEKLIARCADGERIDEASATRK